MGDNRIGMEQEIDAGAQALRNRMQSSKRLNDWQTLPKSTKRKWLEHAACVLTAAAAARALRNEEKV